MTRRRLTEPPESAASSMSPSRYWRTSIWSARCSRALWAVGDFTTVYLVSGGGPGGSTNVLATLGFHYAFDTARPALGVAAAMSALPVLIPIVILLMRKLQTSEVQL